jgi:hypothetical protein
MQRKYKLSSLVVFSLLTTPIMGVSSMVYAGSGCAPYAVATQGGEGGFRFLDDPKSFKTISNGGRIEGQICNRNSVQVELSKRNVNTKVGMKVVNDRYTFNSGDSGDRLVNGWYRKSITIVFK